MTIPRRFICSSHTVSGVLPGGQVAARHTFEARVAACARAGYAGMCLHFRDCRAQRQGGRSWAELGAILRDAGIDDISLEFLTGWFLTGPEGEEARRNEAVLFEAAHGLGAHGFNVGGDFRDRGASPRRMRESFEGLCGRAACLGLQVALEIVPWSNVPDVDSALGLIGGIGNAGLVLDCWHVFRGGIPLADLGRIPGGRILSIQISDAAAEIRGSLAEDTLHRRACGEGVFDLDGFIAAVERTGAAVPPSVEIISPEFAALPVEEAARRSIAGARALMDRLRPA